MPDLQAQTLQLATALKAAFPELTFAKDPNTGEVTITAAALIITVAPAASPEALNEGQRKMSYEDFRAGVTLKPYGSHVDCMYTRPGSTQSGMLDRHKGLLNTPEEKEAFIKSVYLTQGGNPAIN